MNQQWKATRVYLREGWFAPAGWMNQLKITREDLRCDTSDERPQGCTCVRAGLHQLTVYEPAKSHEEGPAKLLDVAAEGEKGGHAPILFTDSSYTTKRTSYRSTGWTCVTTGCASWWTMVSETVSGAQAGPA